MIPAIFIEKLQKKRIELEIDIDLLKTKLLILLIKDMLRR